MLWGLASAVLRFVPYIGPWIAALLPISLSLAIADNWAQPAMTAAVFVILELLSNLVFEPWLYGAQTGVSSVAIMLAAARWGCFWQCR
jgi:predicted PurR-regulated permease PerM